MSYEITLQAPKPDESDNVAVYRKVTTSYKTKKGFAEKIDLIKMKSKSKGYDALDDELSNIAVDQLSNLITNLRDVPDGLYVIVVVNISYDWGSGYADSWDLELRSYIK